jgi:hypothetical protein
VDYKLNFVVAFDRLLEQCGWVPADKPTLYIIPDFSSDRMRYGYQIREEIEAGSSILGFFHQPLLIARR